MTALAGPDVQPGAARQVDRIKAVTAVEESSAQIGAPGVPAGDGPLRHRRDGSDVDRR
jgi:hypothetical protein